MKNKKAWSNAIFALGVAAIVKRIIKINDNPFYMQVIIIIMLTGAFIWITVKEKNKVSTFQHKLMIKFVLFFIVMIILFVIKMLLMYKFSEIWIQYKEHLGNLAFSLFVLFGIYICVVVIKNRDKINKS